MNPNFWHERWKTNNIAFHLEQANPQLIKRFKKLNLPKMSRIFLPLCGKTNDITWLLSEGYQVVGAELSELAIDQLFEALEIEPDIYAGDKIKHYRAENIDMFGGDMFDLHREMLGKVDTIYDRAALVALPLKMRPQYTAHLVEITKKTPQLLITFEYNQQLMEGPPFSITKEEICKNYSDSYDIKLLEQAEVQGGLKGQCSANEAAWLLT